MKNTYKVNKELVMSWAKDYLVLHGIWGILTFILYTALGVYSIYVLLTLILLGGSWFDWCYALVFLLISIYGLFFYRFVSYARSYKTASKLLGLTEWQRTIEFTEDEIIDTDHTSCSRYRYECIKKIKTTDNCIFLYIKPAGAIIPIGAIRLYKDSFVEGSLEDFNEFIKQKITK